MNALEKGFLADGSDAWWNGDARQTTAIIKGLIADRRNFLPNESVVVRGHSVKARFPIDVAASLMVTESKLWQPAKAESPMEVTLCGMVTFFRAEQPLKASSPIAVTGICQNLWVW